MFGSEALEVAIGLAFVYLLFSLICTSLMEGIARVLRLRASTLKEAILNMIVGQDNSDPQANQWRNLYVNGAAGLYGNALIRSLYKPSYYDKLLYKLPMLGLDKGRPAYIPAHTFAQALLSTILRAEPAKVVDEATLGPVLDQNAASSAQPLVRTAAATQFAQLVAGVDGLPDELPLKPILQEFLARASLADQGYAERLALVRSQIEEWFDDVMARVTGWYARKARAVIVMLALLITVLYNIDSLALTTALTRSSTLREVVANSAAQLLEQNSQLGATLTPSTGQGEAGAAPPPLRAGGVTTGSLAVSPALTITFGQLETMVGGLDLPIGWVRLQRPQGTYGSITGLFVTDLITETSGTITPTATILTRLAAAQKNQQTWPLKGSEPARKLAGLLLTLVALSLGAPFWFDLLSKLVNLRSGGKPPADSKAAGNGAPPRSAADAAVK